MKVLLVNPPLASFELVYSSIPILLGQLQGAKIDSKLLDLNIEFLHDILSPKHLSEVLKKLEEIYILNSQKISEMAPIEDLEALKNQNDLIEKYYLSNKEKIKKAISYSLKYLALYKEKSYEDDDEEFLYVKKMLATFFKLVCLPYYPTFFQISFVSSGKWFILNEKRSNYNNSFSSLYNFLSNRKENIYIDYLEKKIKDIKADKYDVIGITIPFESNLLPALTFAKMLKERTKAKIVIGGIFVNSTIESYIKHPELFGTVFDAILTGEGEISIVDYIRYVQKKIPVENVSGLVYKNDENIIRNKIVYLSSVDELRAPSYKGIHWDYYIKRIANIEFSKGCYWGKCAYCYANTQKRYHIKKVTKAVDIIQELYRKEKVKNFSIMDDSLNVNFSGQFAEELIRRKLKINYSCFFRFEENLTYPIMEKLKESGLTAVFFGLESASERILSLMNKGINLDVARRIIKDMYRAGIAVDLGVMYGFPTETEEDIKITLDFLEEVKPYVRHFNNFKFTMLKSSGLLSKKEKFSITNVREIEEFSEYLLYDAPCVSNDRINELILERGHFYLPLYTKWDVKR